MFPPAAAKMKNIRLSLLAIVAAVGGLSVEAATIMCTTPGDCNGDCLRSFTVKETTFSLLRHPKGICEEIVDSLRELSSERDDVALSNILMELQAYEKIDNPDDSESAQNDIIQAITNALHYGGAGGGVNNIKSQDVVTCHEDSDCSDRCERTIIIDAEKFCLKRPLKGICLATVEAAKRDSGKALFLVALNRYISGELDDGPFECALRLVAHETSMLHCIDALPMDIDRENVGNFFQKPRQTLHELFSTLTLPGDN
eukprot:GHVS01104171.1.p1 GENE.GHVS01104171.1~~GHVS01104171.1.p1  ORF type:complete len:257 (+),score=24.24 GHVS01104171.1:122-892(+)